MSTSNNLDTKMLLQYITHSFKHWGINHINQNTLKLAKKNDSSCISPMIRLLFDLISLHIFNYDYTIDELNIVFQEENTNNMIEVILAHLFQSNCPLIKVLEGQQEQHIVAFDFSSSRYILITCSWVMAVSNFFNKTIEKLIKKKYANIYKSKPLNLNNLSSKFTVSIKPINLYQTSPPLERVSFLSKILKSRKYSIECLVQKKKKIIKRIKQQLKKIDNSLTIQDLLSSTNSQQVQQKQIQVRDIIMFEKENMSYRKYWWIWIDQVILSVEYKELTQIYQSFEKIQCNPINIKYSIEIDINYIKKYIETMNNFKDKLDNILQQIQKVQLKQKKNYKDIDREINEQIQRLRERAIEEESVYPSFIGMQIKQLMGLNNKTRHPDGKSVKQQTDKSIKKLQQSIKKFISQIEGIVMI